MIAGSSLSVSERLRMECEQSQKDKTLAEEQVAVAKARSEDLHAALKVRQADKMVAERAASDAEAHANLAREALSQAQWQAAMAAAAVAHKDAQCTQLSECGQIFRQRIRHLEKKHQQAFEDALKDVSESKLEVERMRRDLSGHDALRRELQESHRTSSELQKTLENERSAASSSLSERDTLRKSLDEARQRLVECQKEISMLRTAAATSSSTAAMYLERLKQQRHAVEEAGRCREATQTDANELHMSRVRTESKLISVPQNAPTPSEGMNPLSSHDAAAGIELGAGRMATGARANIRAHPPVEADSIVISVFPKKHSLAARSVEDVSTLAVRASKNEGNGYLGHAQQSPRTDHNSVALLREGYISPCSAVVPTMQRGTAIPSQFSCVHQANAHGLPQKLLELGQNPIVESGADARKMLQDRSSSLHQPPLPAVRRIEERNAPKQHRLAISNMPHCVQTVSQGQLAEQDLFRQRVSLQHRQPQGQATPQHTMNTSDIRRIRSRTWRGGFSMCAKPFLKQQRKVKIYREDLKMVGYTKGCAACNEAARGSEIKHQHKDACRSRVLAALEQLHRPETGPDSSMRVRAPKFDKSRHCNNGITIHQEPISKAVAHAAKTIRTSRCVGEAAAGIDAAAILGVVAAVRYGPMDTEYHEGR